MTAHLDIAELRASWEQARSSQDWGDAAEWAEAHAADLLDTLDVLLSAARRATVEPFACHAGFWQHILDSIEGPR